MEQLKKPTSQIQEVLYLLITEGNLTRKEFVNTGVLNHTARLARLRNYYNLDIPCKKINVINKFGREVEYGKWYVYDKAAAISVYKQLVNQKE